MDRSITEHISSEGILDKNLLEQLAFNEKMAELGKLAAGIVHELNTPLSVIVSAAQLILRENELSGFVREMVERIGDEAHRLSSLSKGVLSFSRREVDEESETDLNEVVREVLTFLKYEAQKRSIRMVVELDFQLASLSANKNYLKQVIINLVMNACQAMPDGGTLYIRTLPGSEATILLQVADTGIGIPADKLQDIFAPFYTTKPTGEGTGLGLYLCRQLIQMIGGEIAVNSTVGEGSTFTMTLPIQSEN